MLGLRLPVGPQRDIQRYLADAERMGLRIRHVFFDALPRGIYRGPSGTARQVRATPRLRREAAKLPVIYTADVRDRDKGKTG